MSGGNKSRKKKCRWNMCHLGINVVQSRNSEINLLVFNFTSSSQKRFIVQNRNSNRIRVKNLVRISAVWLELLLEKKMASLKKTKQSFFSLFCC